MSALATEIGKRIRNYRLQQDMSQDDLAEKCSLHPTYIGQVERGEKNATIESVSRIAHGLSLPLSKLFENIENFETGDMNYPAEAYRLIQSVSLKNQIQIFLSQIFH